VAGSIQALGNFNRQAYCRLIYAHLLGEWTGQVQASDDQFTMAIALLGEKMENDTIAKMAASRDPSIAESVVQTTLESKQETQPLAYAGR
jgi:hypothetical protein